VHGTRPWMRSPQPGYKRTPRDRIRKAEKRAGNSAG
jgi:hypothetical protein